MKYLILVTVALFALACSDGCDTGDTKCSGGAVHICDSENNWTKSINCNNIEPVELDWECCLDVDGLHACLPFGECPEGDAG